jgi:2,3-bisphosphoglycerate-dependent phosphoglycerate mutase
MATGTTRSVNTVVLLRHGESTWNVEKRYTGWVDCPLTSNGTHDAKDAGALMGERGMKFDVAFTSTLERAWKTAELALAAAGQPQVESVKSWKLNERHYGALQGFSKESQELNDTFGEQQVIDWRRSYYSAPPSMYDRDFLQKMGLDGLRESIKHMNPAFLDKEQLDHLMHVHNPATSLYNTASYNHTYPPTESLKECEDRAFSYWKETIAPRVRAGQRVLIVAHANTIRGLVKALDQIDDKLIAHLKIPNGIPLVYTLDDDLEPVTDLTDDLGFQANYLVSPRNHGKVLEYERCVQKKLRSLFQYLDKDQDGRITPQCLQSGLTRLVNYPRKRIENRDKTDAPPPIICEFEIEELLRCIPDADERGGVTLQAFLDSEQTLLPKLSKLRLLQ